MQRREARRLLGLGDRPEPGEVRSAYHQAARRLHPDRPDAPPDATARMAAVNTAYGVLTGAIPADPGDERIEDRRADHDPSSPAPHATRSARRADPNLLHVVVYDDGSLLVDAPAEETFERLVEAIEVIGDPTYVDTDAGLLQVIVCLAAGRYCFLTFSLQGRAAGTEIFTTIERLDAADPPCSDALLQRVAAAMRAS